ncbi:MAG: ribonuclease III [Pseudomonadota bacterium]
MNPPRAALLEGLQARIGYFFEDIALLDRALTHRSWAHEAQARDTGGALEDNERLEFLGDGVFYALVGALLYIAHPEAPEGQLTMLRRHLVSGPRQAALARTLGLDRPGLVRLGHLPAQEIARGQDKILEDAVEALVGAIFLDGGLAAAQALLAPWVAAEEPELAEARAPKSLLQEALQALGLPAPTYTTLAETGPDHMRRFTCAALVVTAPDGEPEIRGQGEGSSKREAERLAAIAALERLVEEGVLPGDGAA